MVDQDWGDLVNPEDWVPELIGWTQRSDPEFTMVLHESIERTLLDFEEPLSWRLAVVREIVLYLDTLAQVRIFLAIRKDPKLLAEWVTRMHELFPTLHDRECLVDEVSRYKFAGSTWKQSKTLETFPELTPLLMETL